MANHSTVSNYRWVILVLLVLMYLGAALVELAPAPLLTHIIDDLHISPGQAGYLLTVLSLLTGIFGFAGSFFIDKLGLRVATILGLMIFGLGGILSFWAHSFPAILVDRLIVGIGYGILSPIYGVWIMTWFPSKEQPYVNSVVASLSYIGYFLAYIIVVPVLIVVGTWQNTLGIFGIVAIIVALLWAVLGRTKTDEAPVPGAETVEETNHLPAKSESGLKLAAKRKEVWLIAAMMAGTSWAGITFLTYLPMYFEKIRGFNVATASAMTGVLPMAAILGGVLCGLAMGALGWRKPFTWPLFLLIMLGYIGAVLIPDGPFLYLVIGLIGFLDGGWGAASLQIVMDLKEITENELGGALAIIIGLAYILAYFVPMLFGILEPKLGMATTMVTFVCFGLGVSVISGIIFSALMLPLGGLQISQAE